MNAENMEAFNFRNQWEHNLISDDESDSLDFSSDKSFDEEVFFGIKNLTKKKQMPNDKFLDDEKFFGIKNFNEKKQTPDDENSQNLKESILKGLNNFRIRNEFCDVVIKCKKFEIPAHKVVLCIVSPYFNIMFTGNFKESNSNTCDLSILDLEALKSVIDYIYTGTIQMDSDNIENILNCADFLQIDLLIDRCLKNLRKTMNSSNCFQHIELAERFVNAELLDDSIMFVAKNFFNFCSDPNTLKIELKTLKMILDQLIMRYPINIIFNYIIQWVEYNLTERSKYLYHLLTTYIDVKEISEDMLSQHEILLSKYAKNSMKGAPDLFTNWLDIFKLHRTLESNETIVFKFSRVYYKTFSYYFNINDDEYDKIESPDFKLFCDSSYSSYKNSIYIHGGWGPKTRKYTKKSYCLKVFPRYNFQLIPFIPMKQPRAYHRAITLNDILYIIGGGTTVEAFNSYEAIDMNLCRHIDVTSTLNEARSSTGVAIYEKSIYAVAGTNGNRNLSSIERFDPREGKWCYLSSNIYDSGVCSNGVVIGDTMYNVMNYGKTFQRFDFRMNQFTLIITQNDEYPNDIFPVENDLYGIFPKTIKKYNFREGKWLSTQYDFDYSSIYETAIVLSMPRSLAENLLRKGFSSNLERTIKRNKNNSKKTSFK